MVRGEALLKLQKRFMGLVAGKRGLFHADPLFYKFGVLKIGDLYRHQLRVYAWQFWKGRLPESQAVLLGRVESTHGYNTRAARAGIFVSAREHRSLGYRIPKEWETLPEELRSFGTVTGFKKRSKKEFLTVYRSFECGERGCLVCGGVG